MLTDGTSIMKISIERGSFKICDAKKTRGGQFNTKRNHWLKPQIAEFIKKSGATHCMDPFAGGGDIFAAISGLDMSMNSIGFDLDPAYHWPINDSLTLVPTVKDAIVITNPPYLAKHSAKRKGVIDSVSHYYSESGFDDLYLLAMQRCMDASDNCVFIVPETYINAGVNFSGVHSITVVLDDVFDDTENPICVVCYSKSFSGDPAIFIDDKYIGDYKTLNSWRIKPKKDIPIRFNVSGGAVGFRAVDMPDTSKKIAFMPAPQLGYGFDNIKVSSRLVTYVDVGGLPHHRIAEFCQLSNDLLNRIRTQTHDVILSPFKGNAKDGSRRRRLDYDLARAILECSYNDCVICGRTHILHIV